MHTNQIHEPQAARRSSGNAQPLQALEINGARLKIQTVVAIAGISSATVYRKVKAGTFPAPIKDGTRCTRWNSNAIRAWLEEQANHAAVGQ